MNITQLFNSNVNDAQSTMAGIRSFKEYCDAWSNKVMLFMEGNQSDVHNKEVLSFTHPISENLQQIVYITKQQYAQAIDDESATFNVLINDQGTTVELTGEQIVDDIESNTAEVRCQGEFLKYLLDNETVRATEFMTAMRVKMQSAAGSIIDKYATLIVENNPLQSIRNFFELTKQNTPEKQNQGTENEFIGIVSEAPYIGGNPWAVALDQIGTEVASFFTDIVWPGILRIGEFFKAVLDGVVKLIRWFISKTLKPLSTNFEKCGPRDGIMDVPIFQVKLGDIQKLPSGEYKIDTINNQFALWNVVASISSGSSKQIYSLGTYGHLNYTSWSSLDPGRFVNTKIPLLITALSKPLSYEVESGQYVLRPYDILIPCGGQSFLLANQKHYHTYDVVLRFGVSDNYEFVMQMFLASQHSDWADFTDVENFYIASHSLCAAYKYISSKFGNTPNKYLNNIHGDEWIGTYENALEAAFFDFTGIDLNDTGPLDWTNHLKLLNWNTSTLSDPWDISVLAFFHYSLISYAAVMGPSFSTEYYPVGDETIENSLTYIRNISVVIGDLQGNYTYYNEDYVDVSTNVDVSLIANSYRPYVQYNMYPPVIHYQTFAERVSEAKTYIFAAIIAAAVVVTLVVVKHFRKRRAQKLDAAKLIRDQMAYDMASGKKTFADYVKADKKVRRMTKMNSLLGISSSSSNVENTASIVSGVAKQIYAMQGNTDTGDITDINIKTLYDVIVGS